MRKKPRLDTWELYKADIEARNESDDCTVVSLAYALRVPYDVAHLIMGKAGREDRSYGSMVSASRVIEPGRLVRLNGLPYPHITLSEFCKAHPIGRYWVGVTGHALVVENGRICDHSDKVRRRVDMAWRVFDKPKTESKKDENESD